MKRSTGIISIIAVLTVLLAALASFATENQHTEDFTTTLFKDMTRTTANWDTDAGNLGLYPFVPALRGSVVTAGDAWDVVVAGDRAFVAGGTAGLRVVDISDLANPALSGNYDTPGEARGLAVAGNYAFVADGEAGLQIIDITDPGIPLIIGNYETLGFAFDVAVAGNFAYVAGWDVGLLVIDISDPTDPTLAGSLETPGDAAGIVVAGDCAFVADYGAGLQVINILDPAHPALLGSYDTSGGHARAVAVAGDCAFVADTEGGFKVINIMDPNDPQLLGSYATPSDAYDVMVSGDYAYVACLQTGLLALDISNPSNPRFLAEHDTPGQPRGLALAGDCAFVADYDFGLRVVEIAKQANPVSLGTFDPEGYVRDVVVSGDYAFLANGADGFRVLDIADPGNPTDLGAYVGPGMGLCNGVAVAGNYAYVVGGAAGFSSINITDPTNIVESAYCVTAGDGQDIAVAGNYAYLAVDDVGFQVIDISDPDHPVAFSTIVFGYDAQGIAVAGDYVFLATGSGLQVFYSSDHNNPQACGFYGSAGTAEDVAISGDFAFVAKGSQGFDVVSIADPENPQLIVNCTSAGLVAALTVVGNYAFVVNGVSQLLVLDIEDPTNPILLESISTPASPHAVTVAGDLAFVSNLGSGFRVIQVFQREVYPDNNIGQSLSVCDQADTIKKARLTTTPTANIDWEISLDDGVAWENLPADAAWHPVAVPGTALTWRSTHNWSPGLNPTVSDLTLEWLYDFAPITSVSDVPDDQGGLVDVTLTRSAYDFADEATLPVVGYNIYRQVADGSVAAKGLDFESGQNGAVLRTPAGTRAWPLPGQDIATVGADVYVLGAGADKAGSFPPGTWKLVGSAFATQSDEYIVEATTAADSSTTGIDWSVYLVTTHTATPSIWFASQPDSGYSVDNIAPGVPTAVGAAYLAAGVTLDWDDAPEIDFQYYRVYRDADPDLVPSPENLLHETVTSAWTDPTANPWGLYYKISTLDHAGNESVAQSPQSVSGVNDGTVPARTALLGAVPNPFNPVTKLSFEMATAGQVRLKVYDTAGRLVTTLLDEYRAAGRHEIPWNGKNDTGRISAAGVYLYRLEVGEFSKTKRMVLLK